MHIQSGSETSKQFTIELDPTRYRAARAMVMELD